MDGFQSLVLHFPAEKLTIAYLSNGWVYPRESLVSGALAGFRGQNLKLPDFSIRAVEIPLETLQTYVGVYVSDQLPVKMTVSIQEGRLQAQPSGQRAILLEATAPDAFRFEPMGITMAFDAAKGTLALRMRGKDFAFRREEVKNPPSP
jgi:D-alanyl-D-alanine carboxypeptidase